MLTVLNDGSTLRGQLLSIDETTQEAAFELPDGQTRQVPWSSIRFVNMNRTPAAESESNLPTSSGNLNLERDSMVAGEVAASQATASDESGNRFEMHFLDGSRVEGKLDRIDSNGIYMQVESTEGVLYSRCNELQDFTNLDSQRVKPEADRTAILKQTQVRLSGRIVNHELVDTLHWLPVYSDHAVPISTTASGRLSLTPTANDIGVTRLHSDVALTNGDMFPCELLTVDEQFVTARFESSEEVRFPRHLFKGARDLRPEQMIYTGFDQGDRWLASSAGSDSLEYEPPGTMVMRGPAHVTREFNLPDRFRVSMDVLWHKNAAVQLQIGADTAKNSASRMPRNMDQDMMQRAAQEKPDDVITLHLTQQRKHLQVTAGNSTVGIVGAVQQMMGFEQEAMSGQAIALPDLPFVHVEFLVDRPLRQYSVTVDGSEVASWSGVAPLEGNFISLRADSLPSSPDDDSPVTDEVEDPELEMVRVFNFRIARWPGAIEPSDLERFLTRRVGDSPNELTHALRAANGDCLRGRLVSMNENQVTFASRLETLTLPRKAVLEVIALVHKSTGALANSTAEVNVDTDTHADGLADGAATAASNHSSSEPSRLARVMMTHGGQATLRNVRADHRNVTGLSDAVGKFSVPWSAIRHIDFSVESTDASVYSPWELREPAPLPEAESSSEQVASDWLDKAAPAIKLSMLQGEPVELASLQGKPVVLDFWATWCGPCLAAMPTMLELKEELAGQVEFIAVNLQEDADEVQRFVDSRQWKLRVAIDSDGVLGRTFGVSAIPYMLILDAKGVVRHVHVGAGPNLKAELLEKLKSLP